MFIATGTCDMRGSDRNVGGGGCLSFSIKFGGGDFSCPSPHIKGVCVKHWMYIIHVTGARVHIIVVCVMWYNHSCACFSIVV